MGPMDCRDLRETISAFVDGEATPEESSLAAEHLASCAGCRTIEARMRSLEEGLRRVHTEPEKGFRESLFARLEAEGAIPPKKKISRRPWRPAAVALAAAAAIGLFFLVSRESVRVRTAPGPSTARVETPPSGRPDPKPAGGAPPVPMEPLLSPGTPTAMRDIPESAPPVAAPSASSPALSPDEMEMIALLDVLSGPVSFEAGEDAEALDLLDAFGGNGGSGKFPSGGRSGA